MIAAGETDATLRRIKAAIYVEDGSALALDAAVGLVAGNVQVSISGAAFVNALGTLVHIGSGNYYYEADETEIQDPGFLLVKYERTGYKTDGWYDFVSECWSLDETDLDKLRLPIAIFDDASPPALSTGATVTVPSQLQISKNGGAYANAAGSLAHIGDGFYTYQGVAADADTQGWILVKFEKAGFSQCTAFVHVEIGEVEIVTTLTEATTPGDLDDDPTAARFTPIHLEFPVAAGYNVVIQAQIGTDSALWMAAYDERISGQTGQAAYAPLFSTKSTVDITGTFGSGRVFVMDILPNGGWQREQVRLVPYLALEMT